MSVDVMPLDWSYPGLDCVHRSPLVFVIDDFLPRAVCQEIVRRAVTNLRSSLQPTASMRAVASHKRRSAASWFNPDELPCVVERMRRLAPAFADHIGAQRCIHYARGDYFMRHKDSFTRAGCYDGNRCVAPPAAVEQRLCVLFCYLSTCDEGGETVFTDMPLPPLKPVQGRAFVHFPVQYPSLDIDDRTYHEARPAVDDKYILTTFWSSRRHGYIAGTNETAAMYPEVFGADVKAAEGHTQMGGGPRPDARRLPFKGAGPLA